MNDMSTQPMYQEYLEVYDKYAVMTDDPTGCDVYIMLQWLMLNAADPIQRNKTMNELYDGLFNFGETELYKAIGRGYHKAYEIMKQQHELEAEDQERPE